MGGRNCCVKSCRRRSHDHRGRTIPNGLTFYCFPAWRRNEGAQISELTERRRAAWVAAVGRSHITFNHIPTSIRVCSRHFHSGKPAFEMLESDPDWVPSLLMGHGEGTSKRTKRLLPSVQRDQKPRGTSETRAADASRPPQTEPEPEPEPEAATGETTGPRRPASVLWRDVQSLLQRQTNIQQPAVKNVDLSFRDFFRDALQGSLEASSRARSLSAQQTCVSGGYKVELSLRLPPVKEENQRSEGSSSCLNCVRLQRRIVELQEKLSKEDKEASPVLRKTPLQPDQDLQSPETVRAEEEEPEWTEPVSPPQVLLRGADRDVDSTSRVVSQDNSSKLRTRRPPRFQKSWLKMFWFLRYSPRLDQMWCHVCRLRADKSHQNLALIKGSRMFKIHNIKIHSYSNYHRDSLQRYMLHM